MRGRVDTKRERAMGLIERGRGRVDIKREKERRERESEREKRVKQ